MQSTQTPIAFSGNIPKNYDAYLGPMFFEPFAMDMANRVSKLPAQKILEVAAGTGRVTKLISSLFKNSASIIATDLNPAMVSFGKTQAVNENVTWMEADAHSLPFEDNTFDCVVAQFGVMFYSDKVKAFKEAYRVLKPGGTFIFNSWDEINLNPMAKQANDALKRFFPIDTPAFYTVPFSYFDDKQIISDVTAAGFAKPEIEKVWLTGYSSSSYDAAHGLIEGTPTITAIEDRDPKVLPELLTFLEKNIEKTFGAEALKVPLRARVVTCVKG